MKKSFFFACLIAMMAIFATSCQQKGNLPKARFSYAVDGMTVTFTNASKDAEEYVWNFGDGSLLSKEANPVHTYAEPGTYSVELTAKNKAGENKMSDVIVLETKKFNIKIDGDFADWQNLPVDLVAEAKVDEFATMEAGHAIKFIADADYLYCYLQYSGVEDEVGVLDIMINTDNDTITGHKSWLWLESGADILIEGATGVDAEAGVEGWWPDFFTFINGGDPAGWTWDPLDAEGKYEISNVITLPDGDKALEARISRAGIPNFKACKVGVLFQAPNWGGEVGALPEIHVTEGASPMLEVKL